MQFKTIELEKEYNDPRRFDWRLLIFLELIDEILFARHGYRMTVTCLGRKHNPKSAHFTGDKIGCGVDIRSRDMSPEIITTLDRIDETLDIYGDIVVEDERFDTAYKGKPPHIHIEINPDYWMSLKGMI